jgi:hypothetical protein
MFNKKNWTTRQDLLKKRLGVLIKTSRRFDANVLRFYSYCFYVK